MVLLSILGLCFDKTYGAMTNYDDGDESRNEDENDNDNDNAASRSCLMFQSLIISRCLGLTEKYGATEVMECTGVVQHISMLLKMRHELLYANLAFCTVVAVT